MLPPDEHNAVSPFRPSWLATDEQDAVGALHCLSMYMSPGRTYERVGVRHPAHMYIRGRIYFIAPWTYVRVHDIDGTV